MTKMKTIRGDNDEWEAHLTDENGNGVDLTNAEIVFSVRKTPLTAVYAFQRKNTLAGGGDNEIKLSTGVSGMFNLYTVPANTSGLRAGIYQQDFQFIIDGETGSTPKDIFEIEQDVTYP